MSNQKEPFLYLYQFSCSRCRHANNNKKLFWASSREDIEAQINRTKFRCIACGSQPLRGTDITGEILEASEQDLKDFKID